MKLIFPKHLAEDNYIFLKKHRQGLAGYDTFTGLQKILLDYSNQLSVPNVSSLKYRTKITAFCQGAKRAEVWKQKPLFLCGVLFQPMTDWFVWFVYRADESQMGHSHAPVSFPAHVHELCISPHLINLTNEHSAEETRWEEVHLQCKSIIFAPKSTSNYVQYDFSMQEQTITRLWQSTVKCQWLRTLDFTILWNKEGNYHGLWYLLILVIFLFIV